MRYPVSELREYERVVACAERGATDAMTGA